MSPIFWLKSDTWQILCPLIKGYCSVYFWHTFLHISVSVYTLFSCSLGSQCRFTVCVSPIYNESRLCSLEAVNHAQWAIIREKVFNTEQAATGGLQ